MRPDIVPLGSTFLPPRTTVKDADCSLHLVTELIALIFRALFVGNLPKIFLVFPRKAMTLLFFYALRRLLNGSEIKQKALSSRGFIAPEELSICWLISCSLLSLVTINITCQPVTVKQCSQSQKSNPQGGIYNRGEIFVCIVSIPFFSTEVLLLYSF